MAFLDINFIIQSSAGRLIAYLPHLWFVLDLISSPLLEAHCRILQGAHIYWTLTTPYWSSPLIFFHASHNAPNLTELKKKKVAIASPVISGVTDKARHTKWITRNLRIETKNCAILVHIYFHTGNPLNSVLSNALLGFGFCLFRGEFSFIQPQVKNLLSSLPFLLPLISDT